MKILIATVGSRGDVQPYVALARALQAAGHQAWILTDRTFEGFIRRAGVGFRPVEADPRKALQEDVRQIGGNPLRLYRWILRQLGPLARQYFIDVQAACQDIDGAVFSNLAFPVAHIAEKLGFPYQAAYLQPFNPTRAFADPAAFALPAWMPLRGSLNFLTARLGHMLLIAMMKGTLDACRREILGLPSVPWRFYWELDTAETPIIYGFSRHVIPKPADWGPWLHLTGYWFLDQQDGWQPPPELLAFLEAGPPPVYVGFGSMMDSGAAELTELVLAALAQTGQRGILLGGWADLGGGRLPPSVFRIDRVPHDWLFPRVAAVVHHGGAGTTAAGLRAGVPAVLVPYFADQPFWGRRLHALGVSPAPIPRLKLTVERLAAAIDVAVGDPALARRAAAVGAGIRAEDGVGQAASLIERYLSR